MCEEINVQYPLKQYSILGHWTKIKGCFPFICTIFPFMKKKIKTHREENRTIDYPVSLEYVGRSVSTSAVMSKGLTFFVGRGVWSNILFFFMPLRTRL